METPRGKEIVDDIAKQTTEALEQRNHVFWRCTELNGDVIAIIKDININSQTVRADVVAAADKMIAKGKFKEQPTIYTLSELQIMTTSSRGLLIHEAKKLGGIITNTEELLDAEFPTVND
jgi:hypothetical protein